MELVTDGDYTSRKVKDLPVWKIHLDIHMVEVATN